MRYKWTWLLATLCLALLAGTTPATAAKYLYKDLGTLPGGNQSEGAGINDAGEVVGTSNTSTSDGRAFLWTPVSPMRDLGGLVPGNTSKSLAEAINSNQEIVGEAITATGWSHAFRVTQASGTMQDLGTLNGPNSNTFAFGINKAGQVVGSSQTASGYYHAFRWENGVMTDLGTFGGNTESKAYCINDYGYIAGCYYDDVNHKDKGFLRQPTGSWQELGDLGGNITAGLGINNANHVVGRSNDKNYTNRAFIWSAGLGIKDLGTLGGDQSEAWGINNFNQVVGWAQDSQDNGRAFVWTQQTGIQDLNNLTVNLPPNVTLIAARGINDKGQIVGNAVVNLTVHAFLLTPVTVTNAPILMLLLLQ